MASKSDGSSTSDPTIQAKYQVAEGLRVGMQITSPAMTQKTRTVATSAKSGTVELRYAPHSPKITDISTSS
jgi:hypothetical protein